jgi:Flp pilus assembly protein TadD
MLLLLTAAILGSDLLEARIGLRCETGEAYLGQGLLEEAESEFREALELDSACARAMLGLGLAYCRREAWVPAESWLDRYLALEPDDPGGRMAMATLLMSTSRPEEAVPHASMAAAASDGDGGAWLLYGRACALSGDTVEAMRALGLASGIPGDASSDAMTDLAVILLARGALEEAEGLLSRAAGRDHPRACFRLGMLYASWGDFVRGASLLGRSLELEPGGPCADSARLVLDEMAATGRHLAPGDGD